MVEAGRLPFVRPVAQSAFIRSVLVQLVPGCFSGVTGGASGQL